MTARAGYRAYYPLYMYVQNAERYAGRKGVFSAIGWASSDATNYTMRGYDTDLSKYVFWPSPEVDPTAAYYSGSSIAVEDIIVYRVTL